jgi:hypothetical protein
MPRQRRVEYAGAVDHVLCRGDRREDIFLDVVDRHDFIRTLAEASQKTGWQVHAFCLATITTWCWKPPMPIWWREWRGCKAATPSGSITGTRSWILKEELQRLGWRERDLVARRRSDPAKLALAARLWRETTLSRKAIAALAHLGSSKSANARLHEWRRHDNEANAKKRKV